MITRCQILINFPATNLLLESPPSASTGFSVEAQGTGSFTGLSYTVPAHASGSIKAEIQVMAITSDNVQTLNDLVKSMLSASEKSKVENAEKTHASANLSLWGFLSGGGSANYKQTHSSMTSMGLTDEQITTIIDKLFEIASKMSHVQLNFTVDNTAFDYSVSGDLELYTLAGSVSTSQGTKQYRMLADKGTAGNQATATGKIIPLQ